jgi:small subunit ribosomal protein S6
MNFYENILILSPDLDDKELESAVERVKNIVIKSGGEILKSENWGRRKLAYNLKKQDKGVYYLLVFKSPPEVVSEIERLYKVFDSLLKFLVIKLKKKQVAAVMSSLAESADKSSGDTATETLPEKKDMKEGENVQ